MKARNVTDSDEQRRLSIGEVARLARITPRAIRYYHSIGLLPEPSRDRSGYRRYGPTDVVAAVRVARLRAVGMPVEQILGTIPTGTDVAELSSAMNALADDLDREAERLARLRDELRAAAQAETPGQALTSALRTHQLLDDERGLAPAERRAAELVDALHPQGMTGMLQQASPLLSDPTAMGRLQVLLQRFRALPESEEDPETLAADFARALPRPADAAPPVDVSVMDKLLGDRLHPRQRRCMHQLRALLTSSHSSEA